MRWRELIAVLVLAAAVPAVWALRGLTIDNRLERWVGTGTEDEQRYREFREVFGSDEFVLVAVTGRPLFEETTLDLLVSVLDELERIDGVTEVAGLPKVYRDVFGSEDAEALAEEFRSTPFYRGLFVSDDGATAGIVVEVEPPGGPGDRARLVSEVRTAANPLTEAGMTVRLVGSPVLAAALDRVSAREVRRAFPVAFMCSLVILGWLLRSIRATAIAAISAAMAVVITLAVVALAGRAMTMVSSVLPPLLWVLALSNGVHIVSSYQRHRRDREVRGAVARALSDTTRPCTLAAVTTALGFASLAAADLAPVREVGVIAAAGILISLVVNLAVIPTLATWLHLPGRRTAVPGWLTRAGFARPGVVLTGGIALGLAGLISLPWLRVESNPLTFLPQTSATVEDYREVSRDLTGSYTMEVVLSTPERWLELPVMTVIDAVEGGLEAEAIVPVVLSPLDVLRKARHWESGFDPDQYRLPESSGEAVSLLRGLGGEGTKALRRFATEDGRTVRLSAVVNEMDQHRFLELVEHTEAGLAGLPDGFTGWVTGMVLRLVEAQRDLVRTQIRSLGLAVLVVFSAIAFGLRSVRLSLLSAVPNLVPIVAVFGIMSVTGIPLDAATVMVASVALGIAVDNTVHLLVAYGRARSAGRGRQHAGSDAVASVGAAMVVTTATAAAGFFSLCLSAFIPIRDFGLLAGSAMVLALIADLYVVPAMLSLGGAR